MDDDKNPTKNESCECVNAQVLDMEKPEENIDTQLRRQFSSHRERLPETRDSVTRKFKIARPGHHNGDLRMYVTVGLYPNGRPGEIFIRSDRTGSLASGALDAVAMALSVAWQHGVPFVPTVDKLKGMRFEPQGMTGDAKYPIVSSPLDYVARWLLDRFGEAEAAREQAKGRVFRDPVQTPATCQEETLEAFDKIIDTESSKIASEKTSLEGISSQDPMEYRRSAEAEILDLRTRLAHAEASANRFEAEVFKIKHTLEEVVLPQAKILDGKLADALKANALLTNQKQSAETKLENALLEVELTTKRNTHLAGRVETLECQQQHSNAAWAQVFECIPDNGNDSHPELVNRVVRRLKGWKILDAAWVPPPSGSKISYGDAEYPVITAPTSINKAYFQLGGVHQYLNKEDELAGVWSRVLPKSNGDSE